MGQWTIKYKGIYIHGYCDKNECLISGEYGEIYPKYKFKSLLAAKQYIGKMVK